MNRFTVEETNFIAIYNENGKQGLTANITAALPFMDADMRELAQRTILKLGVLTDAEFSELAAFAADEV